MIDTWFYFKFQVENLGGGGAQKTICYCLDIAGQYKKSSFLVQILHECEKQAITRYHPIFFLPLWLNCAIAQLCTLSWKLIWPRNAGAQSCNSIQSFAFCTALFAFLQNFSVFIHSKFEKFWAQASTQPTDPLSIFQKAYLGILL